jgi:hypothetical protein
MSDMVIYIPFHGYDDEDPVYISWLNTVVFVADKNIYGFKLTVSAGGSTYIQWTEEITEGFVREVDSTSGVVNIIGLEYLEGEDVYVTSGGEVVGLFTVENGQVTVPDILFTYQVGPGYKMKVRTMRLSVPQEAGTQQSKIKRIDNTIARHIRSSGGKAGVEYDNVEYLTDIETEFSTESADNKPDTRLSKGGYNEDAYTVVTSDLPLPFTLLATIVSVEVE